MSYLTELKFDENGLIPAIIQDIENEQVLMMAYMNREAVQKTVETGYTWFWSRSRQELWKKGGSSGHVQQVEEIKADCDLDTLLIKVKQKVAACHTGHYSCFYRRLDLDKANRFKSEGEQVFSPEEVYDEQTEEDEIKLENPPVPSGGLPQILQEIYQVVLDRKHNPVEDSYTSYLFDEGLDKILKKIGEEAAEVIIGAKNEDKEEIIMEVSDLLYHLLVLLNYYQINLNEVYAELADRFGK
ncbi:bifunctional phosphoribosyl-AMP cyclohydrolase/phosphoribosyl-ATP diphosphatase HisIE [Fuchsiella alkaliacetigena]|uniref:bifunctional phosphoribosyl-AMP cyclohydrolase/phosphoribosyl-ATP diphosphatase HisIE n=1 Tax=Fuchsiella alkaliacetigena TaxID=957042 RepID=UPI00200B4ADF|nr:bifunctional phosphoribosyl-AMP cyclohydrolase/phosphoribosyl-ATP diphosphatase HisIE [Fuchsiella alkaliacetigena]MCK8824236.1 bifunctional phosphoribosyl-AMP cyclohydrolase/phosphoribosyl-ATP diphosphatase HisIE [Fuchsiella alkaliacetigena]